MVQYSEAEICKVFHALGDPTRLNMLRRLRSGEAPAGALAEIHAISLTGALKHLRVLEDAGLTQTVKVGRERRCRLRVDRLAEIESWIEETRRAWHYRLDSLDAFLKENP